jgi:glucose-1-phosphate adenylyltransferase
MELLGPSPRVRLDDPAWPLPASDERRTTMRRASKREPVGGLLVAGDCKVDGTLRRSVLFDGVEIGRGAEVADAVILPGATVGARCRLRGVIIDSGCRVPDGTVIDRTARGTLPVERIQPSVLPAGDVRHVFAEPGYAVA